MNFKKIASLVLASVITLSALCFPVSAQTDYTYKLKPALSEKLKKMNDNDTVDVSVWFKDIDYNVVTEKVVSYLLNNKQLDLEKAIKITSLFNRISINDIEKLKKEYEDVSTKEIENAIFAERKISSKLYMEHNKSIIDDVVSSSKNSINYVCKYAPNAEMNLTKSQILNIINNKSIDSLYYVENSDIETERINDEELKFLTSSTDKIDTTYYRVTNLSTVRDAFGHSGDGLKVGLIDGALVDKSLVTDRDIYKSYSPSPETGFHADIIAKLMVGHIDGYTGAIPSADLYYAAVDTSSQVKPAMESLISDGVTAINCSFGFDQGVNNTYGDLSRWYDHVAINHSIHLVFSSGNDGSTGIRSTNMSYNSIIVGNCNNNGEIASNSSYSSTTTGAYKPDIVAPGTGFNVLTVGPDYPQCTSFAAPLVTSAVIQMAELSPVLCANPSLMKALLLSSSKITNSMSSEPVISQENTDSIALSRRYGSGMLDVANAYVAFHDKGYYITDKASSSFSTLTYTRTLSKSIGKKVRVSLCWDKKVNVADGHNIYGTTDTNLDRFKLKVISPSGKVFKSSYLYDNKQMITFISNENGQYSFSIERMSGSASSSTVNYSIGYSIQT